MVLGLVACGGGRRNTVPVTPISQPVPSYVGGNPKFADSDPVEWPGRRPWDYAVHGVDVSRYQAGIDWSLVGAQNLSFAYIKATEGGDHADSEFKNHWFRAAQAGLRRGAYHFFYFCREPEEQARWFISHVPRDANALPPVLDIEWNHGSRNCKSRPEGLAVRDAMRSYLRIVKSHYGKTPVIYTTPDFYKENELWKLNGYPFWLRSVADHPSVVYPGESWLFWQYTGTGRVVGTPGNIDLNAFHGSPALWSEWLRSNGIGVQ
jgi:lysozyme